MTDYANPLSTRLTDVFFRALANFTNIRTFRRIALAGPAAASGQIYNEIFQLPETLDSMGWHFPDREKVFSDDFRREIAGTTTQRLLLNAQATMDAASLVFAHSILDDTASECCKISSLAAPDDWRTVIDRRNVPLERFRTSSFDDLYNQYLGEHIEQLNREPLMKRLEILNQKCQPVPQMTVYEVKYDYDPERVKALDKLRQDVIHRVAINQHFPTMEADLEFLESTCRFVVWLVTYHYKIRIDLQEWMKRRPSSKQESS